MTNTKMRTNVKRFAVNIAFRSLIEFGRIDLCHKQN